MRSLGPAQTIEERQLSKVSPLQDPLLAAGHDHRINPKTGRRRSCPICRLEKRRLKQEREGRWLSGIVDVSKEIIREGTRSVGQVSSAIARAHGTAVGAWLGNPDPLTWGGGAVALLAYIAWLSHVSKTLADQLELPFLASIIPTDLVGGGVQALKDKIQASLRDTALGNPNPPPPPPPTQEPTAPRVENTYFVVRNPLGSEQFFTNQADAERSFTLAQLNWALAPITGQKVFLIRRTDATGGGIIGGFVTTDVVLKVWP